MAELTYLDFDLTVRNNGNGGYKLEVKSPGGEPSSDFVCPFQPEELQRLRSIVEGPAREVGLPPGQRTAELPSRLRIFGERLYEAVFVNDVRASLAGCMSRAQDQGAGVRIRLRLDDVPELSQLPWEYLYDRSNQTYLAFETPIVRHMQLPGPPSAVQIRPPIRMLVMISSPQDLAQLDVEEEWKKISGALRNSSELEVTRVPKASLEDLQRCLQTKSYHMFHFIGHGGFSEDTQEPVLMLEDEMGNSFPATREMMKVALSHKSLRLVVLNSCEGARADSRDPFAGMAQGLVQRNIPAVTAMQFRITDKGAIKFASAFYGAIANNLPVDNALVEARKAMFFDMNPTEWGTPVLFMRGNDGRLFLIDKPNEQQLRELQIKALSDDARAAIDAKQYTVAIQKLNEILKIQP
ncbi:CHAT domain-containing protein [Sorangium sp. KYC3313]|uniref:CHAT domain-containing protein n=1 Tax=Sorangium sp. KYC3313 TaxID=3449740 RepID=UPI003F8886B1